MPELPDVEVFRLLVEETCLGRRINRVRIMDASMLEDIGTGELESGLTGRTVKSAKRHGKHLFIGLDGPRWLELHFGMTGFLRFFPGSEGDTAHDRLRLDFFDSSHLVFDCQRKLGEIGLVKDPEEVVREKGLGPDPYSGDMDRGRFVEILSKRRGAVKSALMNQSVLAGIGNVYSDEILLDAGIHPKVRVENLTGEDLGRLYEAMQRILAQAVQHGADPEKMPGFLLSQRRTNGSCPRCHGPVKKISVSGRSAFFCPRCQG